MKTECVSVLSKERKRRRKKEKKKRRRQSELCASNGKEKKIKENKDTVS